MHIGARRRAGPARPGQRLRGRAGERAPDSGSDPRPGPEVGTRGQAPLRGSGRGGFPGLCPRLERPGARAEAAPAARRAGLGPSAATGGAAGARGPGVTLQPARRLLGRPGAAEPGPQAAPWQAGAGASWGLRGPGPAPLRPRPIPG